MCVCGGGCSNYRELADHNKKTLKLNPIIRGSQGQAFDTFYFFILNLKNCTLFLHVLYLRGGGGCFTRGHCHFLSFQCFDGGSFKLLG